MLIATLDLRTAPADRPAALAQLDREHAEILALPGNLDFRVYITRDDGGAVTGVHEWVDEPSFAGYLASDAFARSGAVLRPLVTSPPVSQGTDPRCSPACVSRSASSWWTAMSSPQVPWRFATCPVLEAVHGGWHSRVKPRCLLSRGSPGPTENDRGGMPH